MNNEIICPHCKKAFKVDDTAFADILKQVRDNEFNAELHQRLDGAVKLAEATTKNELQADVARRDSEIALLKQQLDAKDLEKDSAIAAATHAAEAAQAKLTAQLDARETEKRLAVAEAVNRVEKERDELASRLSSKDSEAKLNEVNLKDKYESELRIKDEQIAQYKDFKAKQSVKLLGESLEQHSEISFRQWQSTGAFKNVFFGKDNDTTATGTKGDYIYRETDELGNEILSIMFEMKNEADDSTTKKKNEDHFKKLDQDRIKSNSEYAVLVSMLEADSELYTGITDVSYLYEKMYVVRPQFFISMITILRNAALNSLKYKAELALVREQSVDITHFETDLQAFQTGFMKNVKDSSSKFTEAMDGIDLTIKRLEGIKEALRLSNKHLLTAGSKVEDVSIKRLTKNNPTMAAKFEELKRTDKSNDPTTPAS